MKPSRLTNAKTIIEIRDGVEIHVGFEANRSAIGIHLGYCKDCLDLDRRIEEALEDALKDGFWAIYLHDGRAL